MTRRRRRQPYTPADTPQGDTGPDTPAQRDGTTVTIVTEANGHRTRIKCRDHPCIALMSAGKLTPRQAATAVAVTNAWCTTMLSADSPWTRPFVDSSPRPGDMSIAKLVADEEWSRIMAHVSKRGRSLVLALCCAEVPISRRFARNLKTEDALILQEEFDRLADHIDLR